MRSFASVGALSLVAAFVVSCGNGLPEPSQGARSSDLTIPSSFCNLITDPGLKAACSTCSTNPNGFQPCAPGTTFDPTSCTCLANPPGNSVKCGAIYCPPGGQCWTVGTAPTQTQFCQLPGSVLPPTLQQTLQQQGAVATAVCPAATPNACGNTCVDFATDNANCGGCGTICSGTGVTCGGGGPPGVCGCTPDNATACAGHCGGTVVTNNCGQQVACNADCGLCSVPAICNDCGCHIHLFTGCNPGEHIGDFGLCCSSCVFTGPGNYCIAPAGSTSSCYDCSTTGPCPPH